MKITYIKLKKISNQHKLVAVADVTIDNLIAIHDIKVVENAVGELFIAMPNKKRPNGTFSDVVHPISASARGVFESLILTAADKLIKEKRSYLQYKLEYTTDNTFFEQSLSDFTLIEDNDMRFVDESVKDEILSWLNP